MNFEEEYNKIIVKITAIPKNDVIIVSNIPIDVYDQEAEDLYSWCQTDKEVLITDCHKRIFS